MQVCYRLYRGCHWKIFKWISGENYIDANVNFPRITYNLYTIFWSAKIPILNPPRGCRLVMTLQYLILGGDQLRLGVRTVCSGFFNSQAAWWRLLVMVLGYFLHSKKYTHYLKFIHSACHIRKCPWIDSIVILSNLKFFVTKVDIRTFVRWKCDRHYFFTSLRGFFLLDRDKPQKKNP